VYGLGFCFRDQGLWLRVFGLGYLGFRIRVQGIQGLGFMVQGFGFMAKGSMFMV